MRFTPSRLTRTALQAALLAPLLTQPTTAAATQVTISARAIERTLQTQLFRGPDNRYYLRGEPGSGCSVSVENPQLDFSGHRVLLRLHTVARIGTSIGGNCLGLRFSEDVNISMRPVAEEESIAFTDVRLEKLSGSSDLDFLLKPFLTRKVPSILRVDVAALLRKLLSRSRETTGYSMRLDRFVVRSLTIEPDALVIDVDGDLRVD